MAVYEYRTTYVSIRYQTEKEGLFIKRELPQTTPDISSLDEYQNQMNELGRAGWGLVNVQPVLRGIYDIPQANHAGGGAISYSLTDGFYLFWMRQKEAEN
ncbi:hypothetical protein BVH03_17785 [Pseudomonas sp. PA15(2017)]|uniref:hypothetical protein n=1 Tax=Pseudomonas sp. PA15(2017) TaxID=1932111 RepID=UPI000963E44C|nr:hypothetical protein [Pseudomonas sp. PA15(2017)]OLU25504.1 hypothetical protein BVH03_17785 [Pseudomonas sp. PA15(2017)]